MTDEDACPNCHEQIDVDCTVVGFGQIRVECPECDYSRVLDYRVT